MKCDVMLSGVGGQGILSIAYVIDHAALDAGLHFKQAEVHGMAQRGGAVSSHLRLSDAPIHSDLVPLGQADLLLSVEPMEALRYDAYRAPTGVVVASTTPVVNIPDYPPLDAVLADLLALPAVVLVDGDKLAREAGSFRTSNMVLLGAAAAYLPVPAAALETHIRELFGAKGDKVLAANLAAFRNGARNGAFFTACRGAGVDASLLLRLMARLDSTTVDPATAPDWCAVLRAPGAAAWLAAAASAERGAPPLPADAGSAAHLLVELEAPQPA